MLPYEIRPDQLRPVVRLPDGLEFRACADPADPLLAAFFEGYDRAFVLPNEKEGIDGFRDCLSLNLPPAYDQLAARHGPFREFVGIVVDTSQTPEVVIGGANFICYPLSREAGEPLLLMSLNYLFVLPEHRHHGYFARILSACEHLARDTYLPQGDAPDSKSIPLLMFVELNDPLRLDAGDYDRETAHSGLDQLQRVRIWTKVGARIIDFPYVQPALSKTQAADRNLILAVMGATGTQLSACLLRDHLERFFAISVLKGQDAREDADARAQLDRLAAMACEGHSVGLLEADTWLASMSREALADVRQRWGSIKDAIRVSGRGTLHLTLSVLVDRCRLDELLEEHWPPNTEELIRNMSEESETRQYADAVDPFFADIADRERHIFFREALLKGSAATLELAFPKIVKWATEGKAMSAQLREELKLPATRRTFWYLHSNGALSYNLSLQLDYLHDISHFMALSVLQKAAVACSEKTEWTLKDRGFGVRKKDMESVQPFWEWVRDLFNKDGGELFKILGLGEETKVPAGRTLWDILAQPKSEEQGAKSTASNRIHLWEWVRDLFNKDGGERFKILGLGEEAKVPAGRTLWDILAQPKSEEQGTKSTVTNRIHPYPDFHRAAFLLKDPDFFKHLSLPEESRTPDKWKNSIPMSCPCEGTTMDYSEACLNAIDKWNPASLALYFLSGFLRNIMDFLRQNASEVKDGTDREYPEKDADTESTDFLLYVNQHSVFEVVSASRSLDAGLEYLGTCPYLFLVHIMAFHNESLVHSLEHKIKTLVLELEGLGMTKARIDELRKDKVRMSKIVEKFDTHRLDIFGTVEKFTHLNVFRYDTEQAFFQSIEKVRGLSDRQRHWDQVLTRLEDTVNDVREKARQNAQDMISEVVNVITVLGVLAVVFGLSDLVRTMAVKQDATAPPPILEGRIIPDIFVPKIDLEVSIMTGALILTALIMGWLLVYRRWGWFWRTVYAGFWVVVVVFQFLIYKSSGG